MKKSVLCSTVLTAILLAGSGCGRKKEVEAAFINAEWLETAGRYREAISQYEAVINLDQSGNTGLKARMSIGEICFRRLKDYDSAKGVYGIVRNLYPETEEALAAAASLKEIETIVRIKTDALNEGDSLSEQGRFREALEKYRKAQSLEPCDTSIEERMEITRALYDEKRKREASSAAGRGDIYLSQGKYEEAMKEYASARDLMPEDEELWDKIDMAGAKLAPIRRERSFVEALESGTPIDMLATGAIESIYKSLPPAGEAGKKEGTERERNLYVADFSVLLPEYKHYFQGYKLAWLPGSQWKTVTFTPARYSFPFLKMPMRDFEEFEAQCAGAGDAGGRQRLNGEALVRIVGRNDTGGVSAELIDARLEVPGRGFLYVLREKGEGSSGKRPSK